MSGLVEFLSARLDEDTSDDAPVKRRLFEDISEGLSPEHWGDDSFMRELREDLLADLAVFYEWHADYRDEWKPRRS